jgi:large subunit ribosomal protein L4
METKVYSLDGKESGKVALPEDVFNTAWNADLVHEVVVSMQSNARAGSANTKDRSEVRGGGKKPWRQKGTGRARHGSRRSPIWSGGGVAHGPTSEKDYSKKINKNVRAKALAAVLSKKYKDGEIMFVDAISFAAPKAVEAKKALTALSGVKGNETLASKKKNAALIVLSSRNEAAEKSFSNFGNVLVVQAKDVNPVELLTYKHVIVAEPTAALETLSRRASVKSKRAANK